MFYKVLMEKRAGQEKVAVTLEQLRRAYKARVTPNLVRPTKAPRKELRRLVNANRGNKHEDEIRDTLLSINSAKMAPKDRIRALGRDDIEDKAVDLALDLYGGVMDKTLKPAYRGHLDPVKAEDIGGRLYDKVQAGIQAIDDNHRIQQQALPRNRRRRAPKTFILKGGDQSRLLAENAHVHGVTIPKASTGAGREAFNRTAGLHEAAEMRAKANSPSRSSGGATFFSHQGVQPMLNDVNIANTFQGPGARDLKAQVGAMRARELAELKDDLQWDPRSVELIEKLEGGGRISRHGRKHLDRQYAQYVLQSWPRRKP